jgi:hypothetical protein
MVAILAATTSAQTASANTQVRTVFQIDDTAVDSELCGFDVTFRFVGSVTSTDYYDNSGFLYKTIAKGRPGPFRVTATAKGTTLTQQNSSFTEVVTYNADGSVRTLTDTGLYNKFTAPGVSREQTCSGNNNRQRNLHDGRLYRHFLSLQRLPRAP